MTRLRSLCRWLLIGTLACAIGVLGSVRTLAADGPEEDSEVKLGREAAAENDKTVRMVTDPALVERVNRIGQAIAAIANVDPVEVKWGKPGVKRFAYSFKVVDEKDVNAYSLPGGYIYVNKGLLEFVKSDDELAGVLAHEVAHAAHHHMMKLIDEQEKLQKGMLIPFLVAILSKGEGAENLLMASQLYMVAKLNTYGVEAERDADQAAVRYMLKTSFNPVGILTFMERLAREERLKPQVEQGIYRTHPPTPERAQALLEELAALSIPAARRLTDPTLGATLTPAAVNGVAVVDVVLFKTRIARYAGIDGLTADQRARRTADALSLLLDADLKLFEVKVSNDGQRVLARGKALVAYTAQDAAVQGQTVPELARASADALRNAIWQDQFNRLPTGG